MMWLTFVASVFDTTMHFAVLASYTLYSLVVVQWISIVILVIATIQIVRNRISLQLSSMVKWILAPTALLISTLVYRHTHNAALLRQRINQTWQWHSEKERYTLTLDACNRTYTCSVQANSPANTSNGESTERKNFRLHRGSTSAFKLEQDVVTNETYYSLYLFDFLEKGITCLVTIDGIGAPKIYLNSQQVVELR